MGPGFGRIAGNTCLALFDPYGADSNGIYAGKLVTWAKDHPEAVSRPAALDIVPTKTIYQTIDQQHATTVWRYFFLTQPPTCPST